MHAAEWSVFYFLNIDVFWNVCVIYEILDSHADYILNNYIDSQPIILMCTYINLAALRESQ